MLIEFLKQQGRSLPAVPRPPFGSGIKERSLRRSIASAPGQAQQSKRLLGAVSRVLFTSVVKSSYACHLTKCIRSVSFFRGRILASAARNQGAFFATQYRECSLRAMQGAFFASDQGRSLPAASRTFQGKHGEVSGFASDVRNNSIFPQPTQVACLNYAGAPLVPFMLV
jgi:hypothetical protein